MRLTLLHAVPDIDSASRYRIADAATPEETVKFRRKSFMILSCAAPLIWAKLLTVFDLCGQSFSFGMSLTFHPG